MTDQDLSIAPASRVDTAQGTCVFGPAGATSVQLHERTVWGQRMLYREGGSRGNPTVLLLHGMTSTAWNITSLIRALAPTFHVIAPDHVGAGLHPAPTPATATQAVAGMSAHLDALMRQLELTAVGVVAQDIAACVTQELLAAGRANGAVWAVAVEALPCGAGTRQDGQPNLVPADRSAFDTAVHPLLAAHEPAIAVAASTCSAAGIPLACFHAQEGIADGWEADDIRSGLPLMGQRPLTAMTEEQGPAAQLVYATEQDGTPVHHELCRLGRWLTRFLMSHAPVRQP
jgi:pimeloyl-ACP methyl ester carboxylesterase